MNDEDAIDDTERGESAGLLACDVSRERGCGGDAVLAGGVAAGVGVRRARAVEAVGEADETGLVAVLAADSGRAAAAAVRTEEAGVVDAVATARLAGDVSRLGDVIVEAAIGDGLRRALTVVVAGEAILVAAGLVVLEVAAAVVEVEEAGLRVARLLTAILDGGTSGMVGLNEAMARESSGQTER